MRTVGEYTLLESLGPSELGEAFLSLGATDPISRERHRCVVEILDPDVAADPERVEALFFEVGSAQRLRLPGIDRVIGAGRSPEVWVAQPLAPGWSLTELIEMAQEVSDHLLVQVGIWIVARVAEALAGAHRHGVLHGALSPDSVRIAPDASVHLRDLGLGSLLGGSERRLPHRAPELLTADLLTARADVYGLGMVLTTCLLGRPPFARRDPLSTRRAVLEHRFPVVRTVRRALAPRVDGVLAQMCALDPEERPPGPIQVLDILEGLLGPSSDLVPAVLSRHLERMPAPRSSDFEAVQRARREMGAATLGDAPPPVRVPRAPRAVSGRARIAGSAPEVPQRGEIERFVLERLVRVDGPIEEYDAVDSEAGEPTRLRVLDRRRAEQSSSLPEDEWLRFFAQEAASAAVLSHPCIIRFRDEGTVGDLLWIAYAPPPPSRLSELIAAGRPPAARPVLLDLARTLVHLHDRGLLACGLTPRAVRTSTRGLPVFADLSRVAPVGGVLHPLLEEDPFCLSPEYAGARRHDPRSDLFALGSLAYELLTGTRPFRGLDTWSVLEALRTRSPRAPRTLDRAIPRDLSDLTMHLLAREPRGRPPSAQAVVAALEH